MAAVYETLVRPHLVRHLSCTAAKGWALGVQMSNLGLIHLHSSKESLIQDSNPYLCSCKHSELDKELVTNSTLQTASWQPCRDCSEPCCCPPLAYHFVLLPLTAHLKRLYNFQHQVEVRLPSQSLLLQANIQRVLPDAILVTANIHRDRQ